MHYLKTDLMILLLYKKRILLQLCTLLLALGISTFASAQIEYRALLTGRNQVMPVLTPATGTIRAVVNGNALIISGDFANLSEPILEDGMNIHVGMAGREGAVTLGLLPTLSDDETSGRLEARFNTFSLSDAQLAQLNARELYISVTSEAHEDGEIRGQILPEALTYFSTNLLGSNEVPSIISFGSGHLIIELVSPDEVVITGSFNNLSSDYDESIGSHLHIGASSVNGPIAFDLTPELSEDGRSGIFRAADNTVAIDFSQLLAIGVRRMYANVHSLDYPGGELRGQFVPMEASAVFRAHLSGSHAIPVQTSKAEGVVLAEVYSDTLMIVAGGFEGLDSPLTTNNTSNRPGIYAGAAGETGGFLHPVTVTGSMAGQNGIIDNSNNVFLLTPAQATELYERAVYINLASENRLGGALRGQFIPESQVVMHGFMSGTLAVPPSASMGYGGIVAELNENKLTISGAFDELDGTPGRPSLREAYAGSVGAQVFALNRFENTLPATQNEYDLTDEQVTALLERELYVNLPSNAQSTGEVRAQLLPEATAYFVATLSGASQIPAIDTEAYGQAILEYRDETAIVTGSFNGLESDFSVNAAGGAHLYDGFAGEIGEIVQRLNVDIASDNRGGIMQADGNTFNLTTEATDDLFMRGEYVSVLSQSNSNGVIRGQFLPYANAYFTSTLMGFNTLPLPTQTEAFGGLKAELVGNQLTVTGSVNQLPNANSSTTRLRIGGAGMVGMRAFQLTASETEDGQNIVYLPANNHFTLNAAQMRALRRDRHYVNVTTEQATTGIVRGQILAEPNYFPQGQTVITIPTSGERVINEGDPTGRFRVKWRPATDESDLAFVVQSSEFQDFRSFDNRGVIAGFDSTFLYSVAAMDSLLMARGFELGEEEQRYYRLVASDGSLHQPGAPSLITFQRGQVETRSGADLELFITAPTTPYDIFTEVPYRLILVNNGPQNARNIFVRAPLPNGMVFTRASASSGRYNLFFNWWNVESLNVGDTVTLDLTLFTLVEDVPLTNFVEIIGAQPGDPDSTPDNGEAPEPREDDEAEFTIFSEPVIRGGKIADLSLEMEVLEDEFNVFSNTTYILTLTNDGPDSVANVRVSALIPQGLVFTSAESMPEGSSYRVVTQDWEVPFLRSGESARLELTLFSLVQGRALTLFAQVITSDQEDPDSTPANDLDGTPDEDDEASITIIPAGGLEGGNEADLELSLSVNDEEYEPNTDYVFTFTLTNNGPDDAANIFVDAQLPDSLLFISQTASVSTWDRFFQYWYVPFLQNGESATLRLTLRTLASESPITFFAQVSDSEQDDPNSTPNNNRTGIPTENDEASVTIVPSVSNAGEVEQRSQVFGSIYPVPTTDVINVNINATKDRTAKLHLIDFNGRILQQLPVTLGVGDNIYQLEMSNYPAGTYYLYLRDQQGKLLSWQFVKVGK